ncbi:retrovirus-related pol polyprotein from transposon TNT 1-94, partial [Tanacetum coccineum]
MIRRRHGKTPYELLHDKPPDLSYLHVFGALCYPTNDCENLGKLQPKADIGIFIGYAPTKKAFWIYNRRTRRIIETIHVDFDELTAMASEHSSSGPALHEMTPVTISSGLVPNHPPSTPFVPPSRSDLDLLFQPMFDESLNPPPYFDLQAPEVIAPIPEVVAPEHVVLTGSPSSTTVDQDAPSPKEVYVSQPNGFMDPDKPNYMYKLKKALYGFENKLHASCPRGIFINQSKYALESLKKYGFESCEPVDTPMVEKSKLDEDKKGKAVDPSHYRGSAYRKALKCAFADVDHAGCQDTRRSTSGSIQLLGDKTCEHGPVPKDKKLNILLCPVVADQIALDDVLVAPANRLKIGKCNLRLSSDVASNDATLQVVYDVLKLTPFYKAFQVSADVPEIYMQEFWAFVYIHNLSVRFKMNNKKRILNLDQFRDILQIFPKVGNEKFKEPPLEKEILAFLAESCHKDSFKSTKGSKKKADIDTTTKLKPPTVPKEKKEKTSGKGKQKTTEFENISKAVLAEAEQLKIITKRSRKETHSSHASGSGADEGTGVTPGVPDAPDYDSEDDISWKSSDDDQDDEDEDKNDVNETTQDDEDDDEHDDDEKAQDDDDEEQTESEDDGDDFIHPKLTTHDDDIIHEEETDEDDTFDPIVHTPSRISSSDDEDSDNEVEGMDVEGTKSDDDDTYVEDQGNEVVEDTNANLEGRDDVMTDAILPQVQATQEIEDTHVTLTPVNPDGQQQSSSVSS